MTRSLDQQMRDDSPDNTDQLEAIRLKIAERRDLDLQVKDLEERLSAMKAERRSIELEVLPTMFAEAGISTLGIDADGNSPATVAVLQDYVHANIPQSWSQDKKDVAFKTLANLGSADVVRRTVSVYFPKGDDRWQTLVRIIEAAGMNLKAEVTQEVPWNTLTATVRELMKSKTKRRPTAGELDALGAYVGKIVKLKAANDD